MKGVTQDRTYTFDTTGWALSVALHLSITTDNNDEEQIVGDAITISVPGSDQGISINLVEAEMLISVLRRCVQMNDDVDCDLRREKR